MMDTDMDLDTSPEDENENANEEYEEEDVEYYYEEDETRMYKGITEIGHGTPCDLCKNPIYPDYGDFKIDNEIPNTLKCPTCQELTLVGTPPPGRNFMRCICNRLLMYRENVPKVVCTRKTCKRVTFLGQIQHQNQNPIAWNNMSAAPDPMAMQGNIQMPMPTMQANIGNFNVPFNQDVVDQQQATPMVQSTAMGTSALGQGQNNNNQMQMPFGGGAASISATATAQGAMGLITPLGANYMGKTQNPSVPVWPWQTMANNNNNSKRKLGGSGQEKMNDVCFDSDIQRHWNKYRAKASPGQFGYEDPAAKHLPVPNPTIAAWYEKLQDEEAW